MMSDSHAAPAEMATPVLPADPLTGPRPRRWGGAGLLLAGVVLIAGNLRLVVSGTGPVLDELRDTLHLSAAVVSLLPSLWVVCFAFGGIFGASLARRFGAARMLGWGMVLVAVGAVIRGISAPLPLVLGSVVAALGIAVSNVLLPAVVRTYFPNRVGAVTGAYSTALNGGSAVAAALAVPVASAFGSASTGMAIWTIPAVLALVCWGASTPYRRRHAANAARVGPSAHLPLTALARMPLAWMMAALFALQSISGYVVMGWLPSVLRSHGMSASTSGAVLSVALSTLVLCCYVVSTVTGRSRDQRWIAVGLSLSLFCGYSGLIVAPTSLAFLWGVFLGVGLAAFPLTLTLIGLRGGTSAGTAALSTFSQSVGYLLAVIGPYGFGLGDHLTGSWTLPLVGMLVIATLQGVVGVYVGSPARGTIGGAAR